MPTQVTEFPDQQQEPGANSEEQRLTSDTYSEWKGEVACPGDDRQSDGRGSQREAERRVERQPTPQPQD